MRAKRAGERERGERAATHTMSEQSARQRGAEAPFHEIGLARHRSANECLFIRSSLMRRGGGGGGGCGGCGCGWDQGAHGSAQPRVGVTKHLPSKYAFLVEIGSTVRLSALRFASLLRLISRNNELSRRMGKAVASVPPTDRARTGRHKEPTGNCRNTPRLH